MSPTAMTGEPPCPPADGDMASPEAGTRPLRAVRRAFDAVDPVAWDALVVNQAIPRGTTITYDGGTWMMLTEGTDPGLMVKVA